MKMTYDDRISDLRLMVDAGIDRLFENREPDMLYVPMYHPLASGGKRIRPVLMMLSCRAAGGEAGDALNAAAAVELLHTFTLVHDDIMDRDATRRGKPTVHVKWDEATAILAGDGLVALSFQTLLGSDHPRIGEVLDKFTTGLLVLCEGQAYDKIYETRETVTVDEYNHMIECKTARLIQVACECGAVLGNGTEEEVSRLGGFAHGLGMAFQIQDDLLDILSDESVTGKPQGSDIARKKKTFPVLHFRSTASPAMVDRFLRHWNKTQLVRADIEAVRELFEAAGSLEEAGRLVDHHIEAALECLEGLKPSQAVDDLRTFTRRMRSRKA